MYDFVFCVFDNDCRSKKDMSDNPQTTLATVKRTLAMKTAETLDLKEVEKLAFGSLDGSRSIYQDWWEDKPHQILARVLKGKLHD